MTPSLAAAYGGTLFVRSAENVSGVLPRERRSELRGAGKPAGSTSEISGNTSADSRTKFGTDAPYHMIPIFRVGTSRAALTVSKLALRLLILACLTSTSRNSLSMNRRHYYVFRFLLQIYERKSPLSITLANRVDFCSRRLSFSGAANQQRKNATPHRWLVTFARHFKGTSGRHGAVTSPETY